MCYDVDHQSEGCNLLGSKRSRFGLEDEQDTRVDFSLIHDIVPQRGNDFEPLDADDANLPRASMRGRKNFFDLS